MLGTILEWLSITALHRRNLNVDDDDDGDGGDHHHHDHHDVGDSPRVVSGYLTVHRRQLPGPPTTVPMSPMPPLQIIPFFLFALSSVWTVQKRFGQTVQVQVLHILCDIERFQKRQSRKKSNPSQLSS